MRLTLLKSRLYESPMNCSRDACAAERVETEGARSGGVVRDPDAGSVEQIRGRATEVARREGDADHRPSSRRRTRSSNVFKRADSSAGSTV